MINRETEKQMNEHGIKADAQTQQNIGAPFLGSKHAHKYLVQNKCLSRVRLHFINYFFMI